MYLIDKTSTTEIMLYLLNGTTHFGVGSKRKEIAIENTRFRADGSPSEEKFSLVK